ncbi:hypothetical protein RWK44_08935 [Rhizobium sp. 25PS6]|nr:hypothetical protein [Rhizobium sp. 25PS6]
MALQLRAPPDVAETDRSPVARFIQTTEHDDILILPVGRACVIHSVIGPVAGQPCEETLP